MATSTSPINSTVDFCGLSKNSIKEIHSATDGLLSSIQQWIRSIKVERCDENEKAEAESIGKLANSLSTFRTQLGYYFKFNAGDRVYSSFKINNKNGTSENRIYGGIIESINNGKYIVKYDDDTKETVPEKALTKNKPPGVKVFEKTEKIDNPNGSAARVAAPLVKKEEEEKQEEQTPEKAEATDTEAAAEVLAAALTAATAQIA